MKGMIPQGKPCTHLSRLKPTEASAASRGVSNLSVPHSLTYARPTTCKASGRADAGSLHSSMNRFYATFIPGLQEPIAEVVRERLPDAAIHRLLDGAVLFETACAYDTLNFLCFNNIFAVIDVMEHGAMEPAREALETHIRTVTRSRLAPTAEDVIAHNNKKIRTFRVVISQENTPAAIDDALRRGAEQYIAKLSGLKTDRGGSGAEFWFLYRRESSREGGGERCFSLFLKRLTLRPSWEKSLHPGELPPPLAWMLCRLAHLQHSDTVLDPFCGYGSIPGAAVKYFHITQCIAGDLDEKTVAYAAAKYGKRPIFHKADFRSLSATLPKASVDVIITDPPWGHYENTPVTRLYEDMFQAFDALLKLNGRIVILGGRTDDLPRAAENYFTLRDSIPILLSGKKATIYLFTHTKHTKARR